MTEHVCSKIDRIEHFATPDKPYHFRDSGLPNVYLIGIKYWACEKCGALAAEIPAPTQLMNVIAESVVMKKGILHGEEIKFLRKRAGKKAADFAGLVGTSPEHFSRLETGKHTVSEPLDKLIRLTYGMIVDDHVILAKIAKNVEAWLNSIKEKSVESIQIRKIESPEQWCTDQKAA
ncbi:MAG TPA: helix-turn-helix domain-containing protein [Acidobacteriaceae bacterium]|jgi:transcriptional regulator with XRE-family HTH domain|nr:helix-turn-helix domain-containing protein [Acidobacteriaceae bacterium]